MSKEITLIGQATPEQVAAWKKQYKNVFQVVVEGHVVYLRKPDRSVMAYAATALTKEGAFQYIEEIFNNCKLGGSPIFDEDDDFFLSALQTVNDLIQLKQAEIVKL